MRVALLTPTYWPEVRRGTERVVHDLATGLVSNGHAARIVTSHQRQPSRQRENGVCVTRHWRPPARVFNRTGWPPHTAHVPLSFASLMTSRTDVAHAFYPTDGLATVRWARLRRRPSVFSVMGLPSRAALHGNRRTPAVWRRVVTGCDAVISLSDAAAHAVRRELGVESRVIHPGVDLEAFAPTGERDPRPTILCNAAVDDPRKRVQLLLDAFVLVRRDRPDTRLLLNRPTDPRRARELIEDLPGLELVDPVTDPGGFPRLYTRAWVSALASEAEAFGLVHVEAMACGRPAVGGRDGGAREIIDRPEVGRLFEGDEPNAVARALLEALELAEHPSTAAACRARAAEFSTEIMVQRHVDLYRELLERQR